MQFGMSIAFTDPADYVPLAVAAEENGFSAITLPDHLIYPQQLSMPYPYTADGVPRFAPDDPFPDPWLSRGRDGHGDAQALVLHQRVRAARRATPCMSRRSSRARPA